MNEGPDYMHSFRSKYNYSQALLVVTELLGKYDLEMNITSTDIFNLFRNL